MTAIRPVGINSTLSTTDTTQQTQPISQQSDNLRVVAETAGVYVNYGANPVSTNENIYVPVGEGEDISLGPVQSNRVVGVTTGTTTIIDFPEGTGCPFGPGDAVTLTANQSNFNFTHQLVQSVDNSAGVGGYFNTRMTVNYNSSSVTDVFDAQQFAEVRKSIKVSVKTETGTGKAYIQQVQVS
jgi:hypothetical protein